MPDISGNHTQSEGMFAKVLDPNRGKFSQSPAMDGPAYWLCHKVETHPQHPPLHPGVKYFTHCLNDVLKDQHRLKCGYIVKISLVKVCANQLKQSYLCGI